MLPGRGGILPPGTGGILPSRGCEVFLTSWGWELFFSPLPRWPPPLCALVRKRADAFEDLQKEKNERNKKKETKRTKENRRGGCLLVRSMVQNDMLQHDRHAISH